MLTQKQKNCERNENTEGKNYLCCPWIWSYPEPSAARKRKSSCLAPTWCGLSSSGAPWVAAEEVEVVVALQFETVAKAAAWIVPELTEAVRGRSFVSSTPAVCSWPRQWKDRASSAVNSIQKTSSYHFSYFNVLFLLFNIKNSCYFYYSLFFILRDSCIQRIRNEPR